MNTTDTDYTVTREEPTPTRRNLLVGLGFLGIGALLAKFSAILLAFLKPPKPKNSFGGVIQAGALDSLPRAGSAPKPFPKGRLWLIHEQEGITAIHSSCTHLDCLFSWDQEKNRFVCPCHGSEFMKNGKVMKGPATRDLDRFPVELIDENGKVIRSADGEAAAPVPISDLLVSPAETEKEGDIQEKRIIHIQVDTGRLIAGKPQSLS